MKFDKIYAQWFAFLAVAALAIAFPSFRSSKTVVFDDPDGTSAVTYDPQGREDQIYKAWTLDTLTTTEADTLNLGYTLASPYQFSYQIKCIKISGTPSLKVVLDQRNSLGNTDWIGSDSVSISGADSVRTYFALRGANTYGLQHRLRLVGTSGINEYTITGLLKKTER